MTWDLWRPSPGHEWNRSWILLIFCSLVYVSSIKLARQEQYLELWLGSRDDYFSMLPVQFWPKFNNLAKKRAHLGQRRTTKGCSRTILDAVSQQLHRFSVFWIFWSRMISGRGSITNARSVWKFFSVTRSLMLRTSSKWTLWSWAQPFCCSIYRVLLRFFSQFSIFVQTTQISLCGRFVRFLNVRQLTVRFIIRDWGKNAFLRPMGIFSVK